MDDAEPDDEREDDAPSPLESMALPFFVEDALPEPFDAFFVVRLQFDAPVQARTISALETSLEEWLTRNASAAHGSKEEGTQGEVVQVGPQTLECRIYGAFGDPDEQLPFLLHRIADLARHEQRVLLVELD